MQDQRNLAAGLLYFVFGIVVAVGASTYRLGSLERMGPGYFPLAAGASLAVVGACMIALELRNGIGPRPFGRWSVRQIAVVLGSIVLFGLVVERAGLLLAVPLLVATASRAHPDFSWRSVVRSTLVLLGLTWAIFILLLGLPFAMLPSFLSR